MKIIAVDADHTALDQLEDSLKRVFLDAEIVTFDNALSSFNYLLAHKEDVVQIYFPLTIRPFDAFKYVSLLEKSAYAGSTVFTTQTDNAEIRDLIRMNSGNRYLVRPVTEEKVRALATLEQEMCLDRHDGGADGQCTDCVYHWCRNRKHTDGKGSAETV